MKRQKKWKLILLALPILIIVILAPILYNRLKPAVTLYIVRTQFAKLTPAIDLLVERAKTYAMENAHFPDAQDLGLSYAERVYGRPSYVDDATTLSPYFGGIAITNPHRVPLNMEDLSYMVNSQFPVCGARGFIGGSLDVELLGFPKSFADNTVDNGFECFLWNYDHKIYSQCFYGFGTALKSQIGDIIPGWINENNTEHWDEAGRNNFSQNGFNEAECITWINPQ